MAEAFETKTTEETGRLLHSTDPGGLSAEEARKRLEQYGPNRLQEPEQSGFFSRLLSQFMDPLIYVLAAAGVISVFLGEIGDACIIAAVAALNGAVGMIQEGKAKKALDALKKMTRLKAVVRRDQTDQEIDAAELVPGDLVVLDAGRQVPADLRLLWTGRPEGRGVGPDGRGGTGPQGRRFFCGCRPSGGRPEKHGLYVLQCDGGKGDRHGDGHRHGHGDRQDRPSDPGGPHGGHTLTETAGGSGRHSEHSGSGPLRGPFRSWPSGRSGMWERCSLRPFPWQWRQCPRGFRRW